MATTKYVVLKGIEEGRPTGHVTGDGDEAEVAVESVVTGWKELARAEASSSDQAIRLALADERSPYGQFVAVPERSFQPIKVRTETRTTMKLEGV